MWNTPNALNVKLTWSIPTLSLTSSLLVTLRNGCQASRHPSDASTPTWGILGWISKSKPLWVGSSIPRLGRGQIESWVLTQFHCQWVYCWSLVVFVFSCRLSLLLWLCLLDNWYKCSFLCGRSSANYVVSVLCTVHCRYFRRVLGERNSFKEEVKS